MDSSKVIKGLRNPYRIYLHFAKKPFVFIDRYFNYGTNVFDREWDLLVILDACRYDLFAEFAPQHPVYELFDSVDRMYSIASKSDDWIERTFEQAEDSLLAQTLYLSDKSHVEMVETDKLYDIKLVAGNPHNTKAGVLRPKAITAEATRHFGKSGANKYIIHYIQPHAPFLNCVGKYDSIADEAGQSQNVWRGLRDGDFDKSEVRKDYGQNLLLVLDQVETLIKNFEGDVAVTSDHGNAMGEFGLYGHPFRGAAPSIRRVPWAVATGLGMDDYEIRDQEKK